MGLNLIGTELGLFVGLKIKDHSDINIPVPLSLGDTF